MHRSLIVKLLQIFQIQNHARGHYLTRQGQQSQYVYLIRKGEFKVSKHFQIPRIRDPVKFKDFVGHAEKTEQMIQQKVTKEIEISILGPGEMVGDIDVFMKEDGHFDVCQVSQDSQLYVCTAEDFIEKIVGNENNPHMKKFINTYLEHKITMHQEKIKKIQQMLQENRDVIAGIYPNKNQYKTVESEKISKLLSGKKQQNNNNTKINSLTTQKYNFNQQLSPSIQGLHYQKKLFNSYSPVKSSNRPAQIPTVQQFNSPTNLSFLDISQTFPNSLKNNKIINQTSSNNNNSSSFGMEQEKQKKQKRNPFFYDNNCSNSYLKCSESSEEPSPNRKHIEYADIMLKKKYHRWYKLPYPGHSKNVNKNLNEKYVNQRNHDMLLQYGGKKPPHKKLMKVGNQGVEDGEEEDEDNELFLQKLFEESPKAAEMKNVLDFEKINNYNVGSFRKCIQQMEQEQFEKREGIVKPAQKSKRNSNQEDTQSTFVRYKSNFYEEQREEKRKEKEKEIYKKAIQSSNNPFTKETERMRNFMKGSLFNQKNLIKRSERYRQSIIRQQDIQNMKEYVTHQITSNTIQTSRDQVFEIPVLIKHKFGLRDVKSITTSDWRKENGNNLSNIIQEEEEQQQQQSKDLLQAVINKEKEDNLESDLKDIYSPLERNAATCLPKQSRSKSINSTFCRTKTSHRNNRNFDSNTFIISSISSPMQNQTPFSQSYRNSNHLTTTGNFPFYSNNLESGDDFYGSHRPRFLRNYEKYSSPCNKVKTQKSESNEVLDFKNRSFTIRVQTPSKVVEGRIHGGKNNFNLRKLSNRQLLQ